MKKKEYILSIVYKLGLIILSFFNSILINRYLGVTIKGEYAYILNIVNIITIIIGFNISSSYPFFFRNMGIKIKNKIINIIYFQMMTYIIIGAVLINFNISTQKLYIILLSISFQFCNQLDFLTITESIKKRNLLLISLTIFYSFGIIFGIKFFEKKDKLEYLIYLMLIFNIIKSLGYIYFFNLIPKLEKINELSFFKIIKFSFFPMCISLLTVFNYNIDILILNKFVSKKELGIYSLSVTLGSILWILPDIFKEILFSKTVKEDSITEIKTCLKCSIYITAIIIVIFFIIGRNFISLLYGKEYMGAYETTIILFLGTIPMSFFKIISTLYSVKGKNKYSFLVLLFSVGSNIILNFLTIPRFGIVGASISSVVSYIISGIVILNSFTKEFKITIFEILLITDLEKENIKKYLRNKYLRSRG